MKPKNIRGKYFILAIATAIAATAFMFVAGPAMASPDDYLTDGQKTELNSFLGDLSLVNAQAILANDDAYELLEKLNAADSVGDYEAIIQHFLDDEVYDVDDDDDDDDDVDDDDDDDDDDYDDDDDDDDGDDDSDD